MVTTIIIILALIYAGLKFYNTRDEFKRRDAERAAREQAEAEALAEQEEAEEIMNAAIDVDAEIVEVDEESNE